MQFPLPHERVLPHKIPLVSPSNVSQNNDIDRFVGSLVGLAVGDALGASVEFRPHQYFVEHPVRDMVGGGTWGLKTGQWTDDTSMALCLASSLITKKGYDPYNQMVRYKWWYKHGYLSSTGQCFDIGNATRDSLEQFIYRQNFFNKRSHHSEDKLDDLSWDEIQSIETFDVNCSTDGVAGNGALMRLAPVPLFFHKHPDIAVKYAGDSGRLTHGDKKAVDACRYYAALIVAAVNGEPKENLLSRNFYKSHREWFGSGELHPDILRVAHGSYQNPNGYEGGIRGKGYIVNALEAALWAFCFDENSFEKGALAAVNLGDDTDTTAAIYGQLAGAYYGYKSIPKKWLDKLYAHDLLVCIGRWLYVQGKQFDPTKKGQKTTLLVQAQNKALSNKQQPSTHSTFTQSMGVSSSSTYPTETKHTSQSPSDNNELSMSQQRYGRLRMRPEDDKQASLHQLNVDQWSKLHQDTDRSRRPRQDHEQLLNDRPENYGSSRYQHHGGLAYVQQPDVTRSSRSQYEVSRYVSDVDQKSKHVTAHKEPLGYESATHYSSVGNLDVSQVGRFQLNGTQHSAHSPIIYLPRTHATEQSLRIGTNHAYPYNAGQTQIISSMNNRVPVNNGNYMYGYGARPDNESRYTQNPRSTYPVTGSSTTFGQSISPSNPPGSRDRYDQPYNEYTYGRISTFK